MQPTQPTDVPPTNGEQSSTQPVDVPQIVDNQIPTQPVDVPHDTGELLQVVEETPLKLHHPIYIASSSGVTSPLRQCEICSGLIQVKLALESVGQQDEELEEQNHPYVVILTQDCDLEQDFRARNGQNKPNKRIPNILFCEVDTAKGLRSVSDGWKRIQQNKEERYHYLEQINLECDAEKEGIPELGIDFKRYFTVPTDEVYKRIQLGQLLRRCFLNSPYMEHLSARFARFLSRIALPRDYESV